jgi:hypothetical protein
MVIFMVNCSNHSKNTSKSSSISEDKKIESTSDEIKFEYEILTQRDVLQWPFSYKSIWNTPIGSNAIYVNAKIELSKAAGMTIEEENIVLAVDAPLTEIYISDAEWNPRDNRCDIDGGFLMAVPIPEDYIVSPLNWEGSTPNSGLAVLLKDGRTIKQTQPFARCVGGGKATSKYVFSNEDIYGEGNTGAHGASKLSVLGGTLRLGELRPDEKPIRHVLKVNIYGALNLFYDEETKGYRWPALSADSYASREYGAKRTKEIVEACRMGALLAIPQKLNINSLDLETKPAKILAEAFQKFGAYIVDDTAWDVYAIATEWSPEGRFKEQFKEDWGFEFTSESKNTPWARDMDRIFKNLHVVENNSKTSIGGGGTPIAPLAPKLKY